MIQLIRGFKDILPDETQTWRHIEDTAIALFQSFGFKEIRLPIVEKAALFQRGIGEHTDIVEKEMYTLFGGVKKSADYLAAGSHGFCGSVLYSAEALRKRADSEIIYHRPHVPPGTTAKRTLPAILPD